MFCSTKHLSRWDSGCGEFSVWEFGGYEPYHMAYDHFVGNTDCIHVVLFRASDSTEEQYKQVLYWMNFLKGRVTPTEPIGKSSYGSHLEGTFALVKEFQLDICLSIYLFIIYSSIFHI